MDQETLRIAAEELRREMVCCDIYTQMAAAWKAGGIEAFMKVKASDDYHAICYYGEMAAREVEEMLDES